MITPKYDEHLKKLSKEDKHLGGHCGITHTDIGVLNFFKQNHHVKSILDVGCGPGGQVFEAKKLGLEAHGIDGDYTLDRGDHSKFFTLHDYTKGPSNLFKLVDLVWSVEFLEHVEEQFIPNFLPDLKSGKFLVITFARPHEDAGHHHVNCNTQEYWIEKIQDDVFKFDQMLTDTVKQHSTMRRDFVRNSALVFRKII